MLNPSSKHDMFNTNRASIVLAIFAWLMQLSVFVTPILMKHPVLGNGICEQLAAIPTIIQSDGNGDIQHKHHQMSMSHKTTEHSIQLHIHESNQSNSVSEHPNESHCKFCLLLGHQFNPSLLACLLILLCILLVARTQLVLAGYVLKLYKKLCFFLFQNRAPPFVQFVC